MKINNLEQMKKALRKGVTFKVIDHQKPQCVGQIREVTITKKVGVYTAIFEDKDNEFSKANGGKGNWLSFDRASHYIFDNNSIKWYAKPVGNADNRLIMEFRLLITGVTSPKKIWDVLKEGEEILLDSTQLDEFETCIKTFPESDQVMYFSKFRSLRLESFYYGKQKDNFICSLNPIKEPLLV